MALVKVAILPVILSYFYQSDLVLERDAIGEMGKTYFPHSQPMDVCTRTNGAEGIWMEAAESDITELDTIYANLFDGKASKNNSGIDLSAIASFQSNVKRLSTGKQIVLVSFNQV